VLEVDEVPEISEPPRNQFVRETSIFLSFFSTLSFMSFLRAVDTFAAAAGIVEEIGGAR
jgi:hypothetical protein